jgi:transcriptional regulator with XRE-family HTH domain
MKTSIVIGMNIKIWRVRKNITQRNLANKTKLSQSYFSKLEKGVENPTLDTLTRVADALGIKVGELFDEEQATIKAA